MLPIENLEKKLSEKWPNICTARERSTKTRNKLTGLISQFSGVDSTVVVFGSLARNEFTDSSDIDWTLLIDGRAKSEHFAKKNDIAYKIHKITKKDVGDEGTFESLAFSHDLIHNIGGNDDTNKNTTRRILLLLESAPVTKKAAYERVLREVLSRYINEDWGVIKKAYQVPRFLLNDIVRYWRTMCVDFAYKRRKKRGGWALRTIKLRLSRKLIYASGLLACFSCKLDKNFEQRLLSTTGIDKQREIIINHLSSVMHHTPLDILALTILPHEELYPAAQKIFSSYDDFLSLLSDEKTRKHFEGLSPEATRTDSKYATARSIAHSFQEGLDMLFFDNKEVGLFELTKKYGVF